MALIVCPECNNKVSDQAEACPHCGYPVQQNSSYLKCPRCGSHNIQISVETVDKVVGGRNEVRKKSPVTRAGNNIGRAGMILATGGLWALTPKKSKYNEVKKVKTKTMRYKVAICQNCGGTWNM